MWQESSETSTELRSGLTTGSCATACCVAACRALFAKDYPNAVDINLPRGQVVTLTLTDYRTLTDAGSADKIQGVRVATIKDAGDDPDATHGATVFVELRLVQQPGVVFKAAQGVGTVTKTGLLLDVGEPAINPVPRKMIQEHLQRYALMHDYQGGFEVSVGVENGEAIALKTMNGRLGIIGGLSILGTTGIVRPFSCAAYIASIRQGVDVASANGATHIAASTGSSSEDAIRKLYQLDEMRLIEMGDFVGALLKHLKKGQVDQLSICGGFGKMTKLAQGELDLNSRSSSIDFGFIAQCFAQLLDSHSDYDKEQKETLIEQVKSANTSIDALNLSEQHRLPLAALICEKAQQHAQKIVAANVQVEVLAINRKGIIIARSQPLADRQI